MTMKLYALLEHSMIFRLIRLIVLMLGTVILASCGEVGRPSDKELLKYIASHYEDSVKLKVIGIKVEGVDVNSRSSQPSSSIRLVASLSVKEDLFARAGTMNAITGEVKWPSDPRIPQDLRLVQIDNILKSGVHGLIGDFGKAKSGDFDAGLFARASHFTQGSGTQVGMKLTNDKDLVLYSVLKRVAIKDEIVRVLYILECSKGIDGWHIEKHQVQQVSWPQGRDDGQPRDTWKYHAPASESDASTKVYKHEFIFIE